MFLLVLLYTVMVLILGYVAVFEVIVPLWFGRHTFPSFRNVDLTERIADAKNQLTRQRYRIFLQRLKDRIHTKEG